MAGSISSVLQQAKSALAANQVAMATTAKNVSNVNTEGYSRQRVELVTGTPEELGKIRVGGGVDVGNVSRSTNEFVQNRLIEENSTLGKYQGLTDIYAQLEVVFHEDGEGSVTNAVSQFFNNLRTLSTQPDSVPVRTAVREAANSLSHRFNSMSNSIDQVVGDVDARIQGSVSEVNRLSEKIAHLNAQIVSYEVKGGGVTANDERDQRDMAILELSKLIDVKTTQLENGGINVSSTNLGPLVMGPDRMELAAARAPAGPNPNAMRVFMVSPYNTVPPKDVSAKFETGQLGGLLTLRDQVIPEMREKVDSLAFNMANAINDIHESAYTGNGKQGVSFFERPATLNGAAESLRLSEAVEKDVGNIATAQVANAAGDNRAILRMTGLETEKYFDGGQRSFNDVAASIVGSLGAQVRSANDNLETQRGVVEQLDVVKKSASSVSLDEEAMNMLKFQKAFDANAKMIQVADQMMDTIINLKRF
jgi:flagellar hook-associated protein 1 FlgK